MQPTPQSQQDKQIEKKSQNEILKDNKKSMIENETVCV